METVELKVAARDAKGTNALKSLRKSGLVPAVVYSGGTEAQSFAIDSHAFSMLVHGKASTAVYKLVSDDASLNNSLAVLKDVQTEPIKGKVLHADFVRIESDRELTVKVPIQFSGEVDTVKQGLAFLQQNTYEVSVICKPDAIPSSVSLDITGMKDGESRGTGDISFPENVKLRGSARTTVVSIIAKSKRA